MLQISTLFGTDYFLVKTVPKVRDWGKILFMIFGLFLVDRSQKLNINIKY